MSLMKLNITQAERLQVISVIKINKNKQISVAKIAQKIKGNPNRVRFIIEELIADHKIKKVPVKNYNKHYRRYTYEIINSLSSTK